MTTVNTMPNGATTRFTAETYTQLVALEDDLIWFSERLGHVVNVFAEADRVRRGKPFYIYHPPVWRMLYGELDMIVIDLASWAKEFHRDGGFLKTLAARAELAALSATWLGEPTPVLGNVDQDVLSAIQGAVAARNGEWRRASFARLFPKATSETPSEKDIHFLCVRLFHYFEPLREDRNQHRAHRHEKDKPVTAARLVATDVIQHLEKCQELVADLRCLASNSSFTHYGYKVQPKTDDDEARDVVDLVLCGSIRWTVDHGFLGPSDPGGTYYWQKREAHYERLHALHEETGKPGEPFNNRALLPMPTRRGGD